jgi:hypothetical protein
MESPEAGRGKESHDLSLEHSERPWPADTLILDF